MKRIQWHKLALATLAMLIVHGAFTPAEARKGYLSRMKKRGPANRESSEAVPAGPMGQIVVPLNSLSARDARQLLESTYGEENGIRITQPGGSAKGVIVTAPRDELNSIAALMKQADPSDLDFLLSIESKLPDHYFSSERDLEHSPEVYTAMRKSAVEYLNENNPDWKKRAKPFGWYRGDRNVPRRTAIRLQHATASGVAEQLQPLFSNNVVQIEPVNGANIVLVTGPATTLTSLRETIVQMDFLARQESADEIANRTKYIRRMAGSRNSAFRITRPHKPRIRPLPAITVTGDPEPVFENTQAHQSRNLGSYKPKPVISTPNESKEPDAFESYIEEYIKETLEEATKPRQPRIWVESGGYPELDTILNTPTPPPPSGGSSAAYTSGSKKVSTQDNK